MGNVQKETAPNPPLNSLFSAAEFQINQYIPQKTNTFFSICHKSKPKSYSRPPPSRPSPSPPLPPAKLSPPPTPLKSNENEPQIIEGGGPTTVLNEETIEDEGGRICYQKGIKVMVGYHGKVMESMDQKSGEILAIKKVNVNIFGKNEIDFFRKKLIKLSHPNILKYYDIGVSQENPQTFDIISEFISLGSLKNQIEKFGRYEENVVSKYTKDILNGLHYLHTLGVAHKNLKSTNCLIESTGVLKLSDYFLFSLGKSKRVFSQESLKHEKTSFSMVESRSMNSDFKSQLSETNTKFNYDAFDDLNWRAPETSLESSNEFAMDIWSLGCIVAEMSIGDPLWSKIKRSNSDSNFYFQNIASLIPDSLSPNLKSFLLQCLNANPKERSSLPPLLHHPFITLALPIIFTKGETCESFVQKNLMETALIKIEKKEEWG